MGRDSQFGRNGFVDGAFETGCVDGVVDLDNEPTEQRHEAPPVECVDGPLAVAVAERIEGLIGEVESVHRQIDRHRRIAHLPVKLTHKGFRQRGLAGPGTACHAEDDPFTRPDEGPGPGDQIVD